MNQENVFCTTTVNLLGINIYKNRCRRVMVIIRAPSSNQHYITKRCDGHVFPLFQMVTQLFWENKASRSTKVILTFSKCYNLKFCKDFANSVVTVAEDSIQFCVETYTSDSTLIATLIYSYFKDLSNKVTSLFYCQSGSPVAFFSKTLSAIEQRHSFSCGKRSVCIFESLRKWRHFLIGRSFKLVTDQTSLLLMFNTKHSGEIKNDKFVK